MTSTSSQSALADVADPQVAGRAVEREPPRVAQTRGPDLGLGARPDAEAACRAGSCTAVRTRPRTVDVDAEELAEQRLEVLAVAHRVAAGAAVAHARCTGRRRARRRHRRRCGWGTAGRCGGGSARWPDRPGRASAAGTVNEETTVSPFSVGVVDVEARVRRVVGGEREAEQTALAAGPDPLADVEERRVHDGAVLDDPDPTRSARRRTAGRSRHPRRRRRPGRRARSRPARAGSRAWPGRTPPSVGRSARHCSSGAASGRRSRSGPRSARRSVRRCRRASVRSSSRRPPRRARAWRTPERMRPNADRSCGQG